MFKYLIRPESLFLVGTLQAVLPYLLWYFNGTNTNYHYKLTYIPGLFYLVGYFCFFIGCQLAVKPKTPSRYFENLYTWHRFLTGCISALLVINIIQILGLIRVYGGIPLLSFSSGALSISEADEMLEDTSTGQMAMMLMSLNLLTGFYLLYLIERIQSHRFKFISLINIATLPTFLIGLTMGGKRQGLVMTALFIAIGLFLIFQDKLEILFKQVISRFKTFRLVYIVAVVAFLFGGFEYMGKLRSGREVTYAEDIEAIKYLELPLINLEYQVELAGLGPNKFQPGGLLRTLLPMRFTVAMNYEKPAKLEPTSPCGFYGDIHWFVGLPGILLMALFAGYISKYSFHRASSHPFWLFSYCLFSWTLISCHTYNHFLNLTFIPMPMCLFFVVCYSIFPLHRNHYAFPSTIHPKKRNLQLQ